MGSDNTASAKLEALLHTLMTPVGAVGFGVFLVLFFVALFSKKTRWMILTLLLWVATFGFAVNDKGMITNTLAFPLSIIQSHGRALTGAFLAMLVLPPFLVHRGWRRQLVSGAMIFFLLLELIFSTRVLVGGFSSRGIVGGVIYIGIFVALGWGMTRQIQSLDDMIMLLRCIAVASLLLILGTIYQLIINSSAIIGGNRLFATTPNPQHAALVFGIALIPTCYLLARKDEPLRLRALWGFTVGFLVLFLMWTGSRTGVLMGLVGVGLLFHAKIGRLLGVGIIVAIVFLVAVQFFSDSTGTAGRLLSMQNTRAAHWSAMTQSFLTHPLLGQTSVTEGVRPGVGENSYLAIASRLGLAGLVPLGLSIVMVGRDLGRIWRRRTWLGQESFIIDLMVAGIGGMAAGAIFEGFLLGTLTNMIFCVYLYLAMLMFLVDWLTVSTHQKQALQHTPSHSVSSWSVDNYATSR